MIRNRVLYLCGQAPWLRNGGALLRNYWMIDALAKKYAVDLVVADEPGPIPASFATLVDDYAAFPRNGAQRGGFGRLARAAAPGASMLTAGWTSDALREYVANRLGQSPYAAIQVDLPMLDALPRRDAIPIVYNAHNCESALLARRAREERPHLGAVLALDALRVRQQERALIARAAMVTACAGSDLADFAHVLRPGSARRRRSYRTASMRRATPRSPASPLHRRACSLPAVWTGGPTSSACAGFSGTGSVALARSHAGRDRALRGGWSRRSSPSFSAIRTSRRFRIRNRWSRIWRRRPSLPHRSSPAAARGCGSSKRGRRDARW